MFYAYIMASHRRVLYIGFTSRLQPRVWEHQHDVDPESFTARYRVHKLVYFERFSRSLNGDCPGEGIEELAAREEGGPDQREQSEMARSECGMGTAPPVRPAEAASEMTGCFTRLHPYG